ncbi:hypothetical protein D4764_09G0009960 [Takifugu flavidus]|uniref:Uncharacterized protein n=1 Tax=Takifugu flavidus TaxID=433684 RepID=A0A5C6MLA8_9TELE|nr:hypothetical protein D4764_09G0009960 [Takifugu flavidus]
MQWMGQLILTFGKYRGKSFQWLVENDVGYIKYIVDRHVKEKQRPERGPINGEWVKDYLLKYIQFFPHVSCHLEMCVDRAIYGQGRFKSFTFEEMWKWYSLHKQLLSDPQCGSDHERRMAQEAHTSVKQWLVMAENDIATSSLKRFRKYILDREKAQHGAPPPYSDCHHHCYCHFQQLIGTYSRYCSGG